MEFRQPFRGEFPITQYYGEKITSKFHTGIDYGCPIGTEILASAGGIVMAAGWDTTGYGFRVIIKHTSKKSTLYAHLDTISVEKNREVKQGEVIGTSGATGNVTGPHLHFEAREIWNNYLTHFTPEDLPLMSFADVPAGSQQPVADSHEQKPIGAGMVRIVCDLPANVRNTYNHSIINGQKYRGDTFEITAGSLQINGLPYHRIVPHYVDELGGLIAEYDHFGNQILEQVT